MITYVVIFIIGFVCISLWNFYIVIHPSEIVGLGTPKDFDLPEEEVSILSSDKTVLSAWFMESPENKRALIILHGYPAERSDMLSIASTLYPDFTLLLPDARSFGKSGGSYTTLGIKERADTKAALDFLTEKGYEKIGIFGFSVGGAVGILTAAEDERVGAIVSYASFSDIKTLGEEIYANLWILNKPMVQLMIMWSKLLFRESLLEISPIKAVKKLNIPILIAHTTGDEVIPFSHAERLKEALKENTKAEFYFPEGRFHGSLPDDFFVDVNTFFKQSL